MYVIFLLGASYTCRIIGYLQLLFEHHKLPSLHQQKAVLLSHKYALWWLLSKTIGELQTLCVVDIGLEFVGFLLYKSHFSTSCSILEACAITPLNILTFRKEIVITNHCPFITTTITHTHTHMRIHTYTHKKKIRQGQCIFN